MDMDKRVPLGIVNQVPRLDPCPVNMYMRPYGGHTSGAHRGRSRHSIVSSEPDTAWVEGNGITLPLP